MISKRNTDTPVQGDQGEGEANEEDVDPQGRNDSADRRLLRLSPAGLTRAGAGLQ
jgi:hypothetical protein